MFVSVLMFDVLLVFITVVSLVIGKQLNVGVCYGCCFVKFYALFGLCRIFVTDICISVFEVFKHCGGDVIFVLVVNTLPQACRIYIYIFFLGGLIFLDCSEIDCKLLPQ